ncbi:MAG UNVERIFIED_CONTAM: hypothetical protein LVT10_00775 [Anaerolineae bacterium]|jgi:hypothetical protein
MEEQPKLLKQPPRSLKQRRILNRAATAQAIETTASFESTATAEAVLQIIERARTFTATRNADWQPFNHVFRDGVKRVLVPVGCFMMGSNDGYDDENPCMSNA